MEVLSIGNSFSHDAQRYLAPMSRAAERPINCVNLMIAGCPLEKHFRNMHSDARSYDLISNGSGTGFLVSIKEALLSRPWDVVTLQQSSSDSFRYETFQPYANELAAYVRKLVPRADIFVHQTWAYAQDSSRLTAVGFTDQAIMFGRVRDAYDRMAEDIHADGILRDGELMQKLLQNGVTDLHCDGMHLSFGVGRAAAALLWLHTLTGFDPTDFAFNAFDAPVAPETWKIICRCVREL